MAEGIRHQPKSLEGLSLLPWFQEAHQRDELGIANCSKCKETMQPLQRQYLGCGYLPPLEDRTRLTMWKPPSGTKGYRGPEPTVCAGYTTTLPEVREVSLAHSHWSKGNLAAVLSETAHEHLAASIVILDGQCNAMQRWTMTPSSEGGGAK